MADVIPFKKQELEPKSQSEFQGIPDGWSIVKAADAHKKPFREERDSQASSLKYYARDNELTDSIIYHLLADDDYPAASFLLTPKLKWIERFAFSQTFEGNETLGVLAKICVKNKFSGTFTSAAGFVFGDDGNHYFIGALPDKLNISGNLNISGTDFDIPPALSVSGKLSISMSKIRTPGRFLQCKTLDLTGVSADLITMRLHANQVTCNNCRISELAKHAVIRQYLSLTHAVSLMTFPENLILGGRLIIKDSRVAIISTNNIALGGVYERHDTTRHSYIGQDVLFRLLPPEANIRFLNIIEHDKFGYPINVQNAQNITGRFLFKNEDGSLACLIINGDEINYVDVDTTDVMLLDTDPPQQATFSFDDLFDDDPFTN